MLIEIVRENAGQGITERGAVDYVLVPDEVYEGEQSIREEIEDNGPLDDADLEAAFGSIRWNIHTDKDGIYIDSSGGTVEGCRITGNVGAMNTAGAGVVVASSRGVLRRCIIDRNRITSLGARSGAGVRVYAGLVEDCLVVSNKIEVFNGASADRYSANGGGIFAEGSNAKVRNCTVFGNSALRGGGVYATNGASVVNCIVADNALWDRAVRPNGISYAAPEEEPVEWYGTRSTFNRCLMPERDGIADTALRPNAQCLLGDPLFKSVAGQDFHVAKASPAVNAGLYAEWMDAARDLDGNARVKRYRRGVGFVDIGCYESPDRNGATMIFLR